MSTIGFVGLGVMGLPMAGQLVSAGYSVLGFDKSSRALEQAVELGIDPYEGSLDELARCSNLVILMLPTGDIVQDVVFGGENPGLHGGLRPGSIIVDMSSVSPFQTKELAERLAANGIRLVDAPVSGNVGRARTGQLTVMAGGDDDAVASVRRPLEAMSDQIFHVGPVGAGHAIKSLNNLLSASGLIAAAEAMLIGKKFGLDSQKMLNVLNASTGRNNSTENKIGQFVLTRNFNGGFALKLMEKDIKIALDLARQCGVPSIQSAITSEIVSAANMTEKEGSDHTTVVKFLESLAGDVQLD